MEAENLPRKICRWINDEVPVDEDPIASFVTVDESDDAHDFQIWTEEGIMEAAPGDYIIKGIKGEYYPCKPDIFNKTYEPVLH